MSFGDIWYRFLRIGLVNGTYCSVESTNESVLSTTCTVETSKPNRETGEPEKPVHLLFDTICAVKETIFLVHFIWPFFGLHLAFIY